MPSHCGMANKDAEREQRLAAALRENLRRRKTQARASAQREGSGGETKDSEA